MTYFALTVNCLSDQLFVVMEGQEMRVPEMTLSLVAWVFKSMISLEEKHKLSFVFVNDSRIQCQACRV